MADPYSGQSSDNTSSDQSSTSYGYSGAGGDVSVYSGNFGDTNSNNNDYSGQTGLTDTGYTSHDSGEYAPTYNQGDAYQQTDELLGTYGGGDPTHGGFYSNDINTYIGGKSDVGTAPADTLGSSGFNPFTFAGDLATSFYKTFTDPNVGIPGYFYSDPANVELYKPFVDDAAKQNGLDPRLLMSLLMHESQLDPGALSTTGAYGFGQIFSPAAADVGGSIYDPFGNIYTSAAYLKKQISKFGDDPNAEIKGVAAYNQGYGNYNAGISYGVQVVRDAYGTPKGPGKYSGTPESAPPAATPSDKPKTFFGLPVPKFMQPKAPGSTPSTPTEAPSLIPAIVRNAVIGNVLRGGDYAGGNLPAGGHGSAVDPTPNVTGATYAPAAYANSVTGLSPTAIGDGAPGYKPGVIPAGWIIPPAPQYGFPGLSDSVVGPEVDTFLGNINKVFTYLTLENIIAMLLIVFLLYTSTRVLVS